MPYNIHFKPERRLSLKMLGNRVRRYFPILVYPAFLRIRFTFFRRRCDDGQLPSIAYSDGSWIKRKTTADLRRITAFLAERKECNSILQIGIGNSSLFATIGNAVNRFVGITIVSDEVEHVRTNFPNQFGLRYTVLLMNKYSDELASLEGGFDFIVDNDLSSYACCRHHFGSMLNAYRGLLAPGGCVLIGIDGLGYFDSGFGLTQGLMTRLAIQHGFSFHPGTEFHMLRVNIP